MSDTRMAGLRVTTLTEQGRTAGQHTRVVGAVRCVTQRAILAHWRMLPKEWAALFCVALVTGVVDGLTDKLLGSRFPVGAMATTASHFALEKRVGIRL